MGKKVGEKVEEKTGEKVGESLGEIHKLNLCLLFSSSSFCPSLGPSSPLPRTTLGSYVAYLGAKVLKFL